MKTHCFKNPDVVMRCANTEEYSDFVASFADSVLFSDTVKGRAIIIFHGSMVQVYDESKNGDKKQ